MLAKLSDKTIVKLMLGALILVAGIPLLLSIVSMATDSISRAQQSPQPPLSHPLIRISIGKDISSIPDLSKWRKEKDGQYETYYSIDESGEIQIDLPSGRQLRYQAYSGVMTQENGIAKSLRIRIPPAEVDYFKTIDNLETELIKISEKSRENCAAKLKSIRDIRLTETSASEHIGCYYEFEAGIRVLGAVKWSIDTNDMTKKWLTSLEFSLSKTQKIKSCCQD